MSKVLRETLAWRHSSPLVHAFLLFVALLEHIVFGLFDLSVVYIDLDIGRLGLRDLGDWWAGIFSDNVLWRNARFLWHTF
jgi:hypothetical protein